ncbi:MAG: hypothetical protein HN560_16195 [Anaerolineae bacterium]|jgi:hypothetical protein|nr:hypothetical protein [Anaerolineae bacterium]MBT7070430.1 hypothetical protein [Anaerolineae bacterium]MBT7602591.1 hypothetical protein [Anaerolineae bacterium]MBT7990621.1 hypothetical protein [Anaerolineae bacterium]
MEEAVLDKISITFIILAFISAHHFYFGKNIPKWSWYLSIAFSFAAGMFLGFAIANFPANIILGSAFSAVVFLTNLVVRKYRNKQNDYTFK